MILNSINTKNKFLEKEKFFCFIYQDNYVKDIHSLNDQLYIELTDKLSEAFLSSKSYLTIIEDKNIFYVNHKKVEDIKLMCKEIIITKQKDIIQDKIYNLYNELIIKLDEIGKNKNDIKLISTELFSIDDSRKIMDLSYLKEISFKQNEKLTEDYFVFLKDGKILTNSLDSKNEIRELI